MTRSEADTQGRWPIKLWVADVAAFGLPSGRSLSGLTVHKYAWTEFVSACEEHRVLGLLAEALRTGAVSLEDYQREAVVETVRTWLTHDLWVERELLRVADVLTNAGIPFRVLKGVALANTVYADPSLRLFGDIDVLVAADHFVEASELLVQSLAAARELPELRPGFDRRFGREILLRSGATEIDVHRTLVDGPYGLTSPLADLVDDPIEFPLGDRVLPGLGRTDRFLHACYSVVLGDWPPRLMAQRDVAELLIGGPRPGNLSSDAVIDRAARWKAQAVVALAVLRTVEDLDLRIDHPLVDWARTFRPGALDRLMLAAYRGRARGYTSQALSLVVLPGARDRLDYLRAVVRPSREYLDARGFRRGDRVRKALGLTVSRRR